MQLLQRTRVQISLALFLCVLVELLAGDACQVLCGVPLVENCPLAQIHEEQLSLPILMGLEPKK